MAPTVKLSKDDGQPLTDASVYRRLVGQLLYLTNTRPDISYAVSHLSQFLSKPMESHYQAALRVLRYLKGSPGHGLFFPMSSKLQLKAFSNSNLGRLPRNSTLDHWLLCLSCRVIDFLEIKEAAYGVTLLL